MLFRSVQTSGGSTFYIVIDYDKPTDEDAEQYETYFFSVVDEADLLAALEASGTELPECTCTEKCVAGAINMDCPVCSTNMTECCLLYTSGKLFEVEQDNVGTEGAHRSELVGESALRHGKRFVQKKIREHPAKAVRKAESRHIKATAMKPCIYYCFL